MGAHVICTRGQGRGDEGGAAREPRRQCALSRARRSPEELIRFVAAPDGTLVPDLARRLPGRGVWIEANAAAVATAVRRKAFARSLKRQVAVPDDLPELVERLLAKRLAAAISIANKAGLITAGYVRVARRLRNRSVVALVHAADASPIGTGRLDRLFKALPGPAGREAHIIRELTSAELSLAIGQPTVVHAAAAEGGASARLVAEALRLRRYRETPCPRANDAGGAGGGEDGRGADAAIEAPEQGGEGRGADETEGS
jgi:predicted RNA-binding protein YlxR (DUF448 family)